MTDAVVEFLLENLKNLLLYNVDLISGGKEEVECLFNELSLMKAFLRDSSDKRSEYETIRELVRQIRGVALEAENIIDDFVATAAMQKARSPTSRFVHTPDYTLTLSSVGKDIESIKLKIKDIYEKKKFGIEFMRVGEPSTLVSPAKRVPHVEEDNVVGFDGEAKTIVNRLTKGSDQLEVISVVGGRVGKTTLAKKIYTDPAIKYHFYLRVWVYVSKEYSRRKVYLNILSNIRQPTGELFAKSDKHLREELFNRLKCEKYLIVMDDVCTTEAWHDLRTAFPKNDRGCRILLTSRMSDVAICANPYAQPHHLNFLDDDDSWDLLSSTIFRKGICPPELKDLGKIISKKCCGLPLAIVVAAGILSKKKTRDWWKRVAESVSSASDPMDVLALSYKHLPDHLKACFIYFGVFPEDFEIPVWKLLRIWVAEGFIQQMREECLEDIAEEYLEDLVDRNLVLVGKKRSNGELKTCRIHGMLRDFCLKQAAEEKFLLELKGLPSSFNFTPGLNNERRLSIHSNVLKYICSKPVGRHVRSFLCLSPVEIDLPREYISFIHRSFYLLRVLDIECINIPCFPIQ